MIIKMFLAIIFLEMRNSFLLAGVTYGLTTDPNFEVIRCNNEATNEPELTLKISPTYFNSKLSWLLDEEYFKIQYIYTVHYII